MIEMAPRHGFLSLGHAAARRSALQAAAADRLAGTWLVHGPSGAGKDAFVDDLLALAFCTSAQVERAPCNACDGCRGARSRAHADLVVASPESWREARSTGESIVSAARRWLLDVSGAPIAGPRRVALIEHADRAGEQIQNALLKVLEEPTDRHTFVLVADDAHRLLPTIRSRCRPLRIGRVPRGELAAHLVDRERLPADQADALARVADGLAGMAIRFARDPERLGWQRRTQLQLLGLVERGRADRFAAVRDLIDDAVRIGASTPTDAGPPSAESDAGAGEARTPASAQRAAAMQVVGAWLSLSRDMLVAAAGRAELATASDLTNGPVAGPTSGEAAGLVSLASRIGAAVFIGMIATLERIEDALAQNASPRLALERAMLSWPMLESR